MGPDPWGRAVGDADPPVSIRAGAGNDDALTQHNIDLPDNAGWQRKPATPPDDKIPLE